MDGVLKKYIESDRVTYVLPADSDEQIVRAVVIDGQFVQMYLKAAFSFDACRQSIEDGFSSVEEIQGPPPS